jgi:hypothetical protein
MSARYVTGKFATQRVQSGWCVAGVNPGDILWAIPAFDPITTQQAGSYYYYYHSSGV